MMALEQIKTWWQGFYPKMDQFYERKQIRWIVDLIVVAVLIGFTMYLFGSNLDASWSVLDDHEIVNFIGGDHVFGFSEIMPTLLTQTEINPSSTTPRFRPAYYFLRLVETRLWYRVGPIGWYSARIAIFIFFIITVYYFLRRLNGQITAAALAILITNFNFWGDVTSRLGPSENYVLLSLALFLLGVLFFQNKKDSGIAWILMMTGMMISVGSKENMIILMMPFVYLFVRFLHAKPKRRLIPWVSVGISTVWSAWIMITILLRVKTSGTDVYSNSINFTQRFSSIWTFTQNHVGIIVFLVILLLAGLIGICVRKLRTMKSIFVPAFWGSVLVFALLLSQLFFYSGKMAGRYNIPFAFYLPMTISLGALVFHEIFKFIRCRPCAWLSSLIAVIFVIISMQPQNWHKVHDTSGGNAIRTYNFSVAVDQIVDYASQNPNSAIIFFGGNANSDYEVTSSYQRFLAYWNVHNTIHIVRDVPQDYETVYAPSQVKLEKEMLDMSENGNDSWGIAPISEFDGDPGHCLLVTLRIHNLSPIRCSAVVDGDVLKVYPGIYDK